MSTIGDTSLTGWLTG